jgi:uncharacterized protein
MNCWFRRSLRRACVHSPRRRRGDIFLDFEGDQFTFEGGLEYLFGVLTIASDEGKFVYEPTWAMSPLEEKRAFEEFIKMVMERRRLYPDLHIYHYGAYEETAINRMAGQHSTCVDEVDELLRGEVLLDMFRAVRQGLRASVESYSIKKLEPFYEYQRDVNLPDANLALQTFQTVLAFGPGEESLDDIRKAIEGYNRDDCVSALRLRDWLERLRTELEDQFGAPLARPVPKAYEPSEDLTDYLRRVRALEQRLMEGLRKTKRPGRTDKRQPRCWLICLSGIAAKINRSTGNTSIDATFRMKSSSPIGQRLEAWFMSAKLIK